VKINVKLIIYIVLVHALFVALSLLLLPEHKYLFFLAEALIIRSVVVSMYLYRDFLKPLNIISAGIESIKDQDFNTKLVGSGKDVVGKLIEVYNRMIDQLRQERVKQKEQHNLLLRLIEASPLGVIILDLDGNIEIINPVGRKMLNSGHDPLVGRPITSFSDLPGSELGSLKQDETRIVRLNGIQTYRVRQSRFVDRGFHRQFILIEELTKEILHTQKRAYEKVIRMMSHEINNSVGAINSILNTAINAKGDLDPVSEQEYRTALQIAIDRNVGLNKFMSNFADVVRIPPPSKESCDLHVLLKAVQILVSIECADRDIFWRWELSNTPLTVEVDVQQMEQVLVNIVKNAIEAIGRDGNITVQTTSEEPKGLRIIDSGMGIPAAARPQLFTPFFSTKRDGQGIGLTVIREILINHGFSFNLETVEPGVTEFWIEFGETRIERS